MSKIEDNRIPVTLDLDKELLFNLMLMAHEKDITTNDLANDLLVKYFEEQKAVVSQRPKDSHCQCGAQEFKSPLPQYLYYVEYRTLREDKTLDTNMVFLATNKKKAKKFMKRNSDYGDADINWWWCLQTMPINIDKTSIVDNNSIIEFYNKTGMRLLHQPWK